MKRTIQGIVVSDKMAKTIVVEVEKVRQHSKYLRRFLVKRKFKVHDENKQAKIGDIVIFEECRPLSKEKRWLLVEVINKQK